MFKKLVSMVVVAGFLITGGTAFAVTKTDKGSEQGIIIIQGKVTDIKGNVITIKDNKGIKRKFELYSAAGIRIGEIAICEEDCGKGLRIGDKVIKVKRVIEDDQRR
jgi:hypothetical protein